MVKFWTVLCILILYSTLTALSLPLVMQKRQSDQRIAELETLLALQRYGNANGHFKTVGKHTPGFGLIDFNLIGRRKKSSGAGIYAAEERMMLPSLPWPLKWFSTASMHKPKAIRVLTSNPNIRAKNSDT